MSYLALIIYIFGIISWNPWGIFITSVVALCVVWFSTEFEQPSWSGNLYTVAFVTSMLTFAFGATQLSHSFTEKQAVENGCQVVAWSWNTPIIKCK